MGRCHFPEEYDTPLVSPAFQPASNLAMAPQTEWRSKQKWQHSSREEQPLKS